MTASIIDGKLIAEQVRGEVAEEVAKLTAAGMPRPGLATVLVGDNPASRSYVTSKQKACAESGLNRSGLTFRRRQPRRNWRGVVAELNADPKVNGILVQLPLPGHLDEEGVLSPSASKRTWTAFIRSTSAGWPEGARPAVRAVHASGCIFY